MDKTKYRGKDSELPQVQPSRSPQNLVLLAFYMGMVDSIIGH